MTSKWCWEMTVYLGRIRGVISAPTHGIYMNNWLPNGAVTVWTTNACTLTKDKVVVRNNVDAIKMDLDIDAQIQDSKVSKPREMELANFFGFFYQFPWHQISVDFTTSSTDALPLPPVPNILRLSASAFNISAIFTTRSCTISRRHSRNDSEIYYSSENPAYFFCRLSSQTLSEPRLSHNSRSGCAPPQPRRSALSYHLSSYVWFRDRRYA